MSISFIKGLTASILSNFSTIKRQVKRLHKESPRLLGRQLTTDECQEVIAAINGYRRWADLAEIGIRTGVDRSLPPYSIQSRNDVHESCLSTLVDFELELDESKPVVVLGQHKDAALPAYCLWAETISARRTPGLVLIETDKPTLQDTALWGAITALGLDETATRFRVIDAREKTLPVAVTATARGWAEAVDSTLTEQQQKEFDSSGGHHLLEKAIEAYAGTSGWMVAANADLPATFLSKGIFYLSHHAAIKEALFVHLQQVERDSLSLDTDACAHRIPAGILDTLKEVRHAIDESEIGLGPVMWSETEHRPAVVLFDRTNRLSEIIAAAIHEQFYGRYVSQRAIRPILFFGDVQATTLPTLLGFASNTVICTGDEVASTDKWAGVTMRRALFCTAAEGALTYSGRKARLPTSV
ncbi:MAG: hypothetical protein KAX55_01735 [Propionivibrio sp.]|nr:hypothetical protein [Propionivibrio sp.]